MNEKTYAVTLKISTTDNGTFESVKLLKGRSGLPDEILSRLNIALRESLVPTPPVQTSVAIGNDAEKMVMHHLLSISQVNVDFVVIDTSSGTGHGDIAVVHKSKCVCIEVKNYAKPVPMKEVDKFHRSLGMSEYQAGIIIQMNTCGFARESGLHSPIDIQCVEGKPAAYVTASDLTDLKLLYPVLTMLITKVDNASFKDCTQLELEAHRKALLRIYEETKELRACVDLQKKAISRMEAAVDTIAGLSGSL
jgi:hypothetical protein